MNDIDRLTRITKRARIIYRIRHAVEGAILVAIVAAAVSFVTMLMVGLGYLSSSVWSSLAAGSVAGVVMGAFIGLMRPQDDARVLQRVDRDHKLGNALSTAREFLLASRDGAQDALTMAHVRQSLERAEGLVFARAVAINLGTQARILGILCACLISVSLI